MWLSDRLDTVVGDLSHGQQRQLEVGMVVVTEPQLMMLDEPASGLSRGERERLTELLSELARRTRPCCSSNTTWTWPCASPSGWW